MKYNKLVRDKIPQIIKNNGNTSITHIADDDEYREKLLAKLTEEVDEFLEDNNPEELADILEVVYSLGKLQNISKDELEKIRSEKFEKRGGFAKKIILDETN